MVALAMSLGGLVAALRNFNGWGLSVAVTGFAAAVVLEWVRMGK